MHKCKHKRRLSEIIQSPNFLSVFTFNFHVLPFKANRIYSLTLGPLPLILRPDLVITSLVRFGREFAMGLEYNLKVTDWRRKYSNHTTYAFYPYLYNKWSSTTLLNEASTYHILPVPFPLSLPVSFSFSIFPRVLLLLFFPLLLFLGLLGASPH